MDSEPSISCNCNAKVMPIPGSLKGLRLPILCRCYGASGEGMAPSALFNGYRRSSPPGQAGREIKRIVVAYEAGRDGFWLARWLRARDIEAYVIHPTSIAVSREHRRAKTDRLDTELLMRAFLGW